MSEHIWIVRSPEGKAIGAGIVASGAIRDTQAHCGSTTNGIMQRMFGHVHSGTEDSYEQDGYTLTREPLTPSDGTSSTGAAGTPTPASARVPAGHTGSDAAPPVVVLDEWRVVDKDGRSDGTCCYSHRDALHEAASMGRVFPLFAPHRVMRVCLQEVSDA